MTADEMRKRALDFLKNEGIDDLLIRAYLEMKHYATWDKNQPDKEWNCGVSNIKKEVFDKTKLRRSGYLDWLMSANLLGMNFKIGGYSYSFSDPFGERSWSYEVVLFYINEKLHIEVEYEDTGRDWSLAEDYRISSVEEFHNSPEIKSLLSEISRLIKEKQIRYEEKLKQEKEEKYKGKFDF